MNNAPTRDRDEASEQDEHVEERRTEDNNGAPAPFAPDSDDKTPLGDTDEHSDA
jgi:hypothetical protein